MADHTVPGGASDESPSEVPDKELRFSRFDPVDQRLQIINDDKNFSPIVSEYMKKHWHLANSGFNYNIVAVFGSQSTGKSTLLNRLFGTNFDVMNEASGRQQTTKGIWVSKSDESNTLVLDVEGTDGGERFEDQDFERKSALFSLAISEVVIVNMYENNVGLYNGANLGLLKTVLDVNLQLFQQAGNPKTCLHFVIRDFTNQTPLERLQATVTTYLEKIWSTLNKPAGKEDCSLYDFFVLNFSGLPHKIFAREAFESAVAKLRTRFSDPTALDYVFLPVLHKRVPADGFSSFAHDIWERISASKELDLPTQTQLLAEHRCEEIAKEIFDEEFLVESIAALKRGVEVGRVVEEFGEVVNNVVDECIMKFDENGSRYNSIVYKRKRAEFYKRMATYLLPVYNAQLTNITKTRIAAFSASLSAGLAADVDAGVPINFAKHTTAVRREAENSFLAGAASSRLSQVADDEWSAAGQYGQLVEEIERISAELRSGAVDKMLKAVEGLAVGNMNDNVLGRMNSGASVGMWVSILESFKEALDFEELQIQKRGQGFEASAEELELWKSTLRWQTWTSLLETLKKETADDAILARLKGIFDNKFRYDEQGIPRLWNLDDPIDSYFASATEDAEKALSIFAKLDVPLKLIGDNIIDDQRFDPACVTIIPANRLQNIRERFKRDAQTLFVEAKRSMVVTTAKIPPWFIALTLVLGWNEFMMVLFNPVYFALLAIFLGIGYLSWQMGMVGPAYQVAKVTVREVTNQAIEKLENNGVEVPEFMRSSQASERKRKSTVVKRVESVNENIEMTKID
ncbi:Dynamin-like GTPase that mediates homotypic ER fusion [Physocladia obscura]|uniref:Dynamin-like GTPase that mediates homotypic ER fusion n=1 Tax=Physocladia obscura TaxID=109957 RepID=A0AAD5SYU8_9FUNG|nr:Dynamin-like GTPase that mediates homotypic ER fusion [Physocladia obscura]